VRFAVAYAVCSPDECRNGMMRFRDQCRHESLMGCFAMACDFARSQGTAPGRSITRIWPQFATASLDGSVAAKMRGMRRLREAKSGRPVPTGAVDVGAGWRRFPGLSFRLCPGTALREHAIVLQRGIASTSLEMSVHGGPKNAGDDVAIGRALCRSRSGEDSGNPAQSVISMLSVCGERKSCWSAAPSRILRSSSPLKGPRVDHRALFSRGI
jgi:hypothetical protein